MGSLVTPLSFLLYSLKDHQKASHTDFRTIEAQAMPWQVNPKSLAETQLSEQPALIKAPSDTGHNPKSHV